MHILWCKKPNTTKQSIRFILSSDNPLIVFFVVLVNLLHSTVSTYTTLHNTISNESSKHSILLSSPGFVFASHVVKSMHCLEGLKGCQTNQLITNQRHMVEFEAEYLMYYGSAILNIGYSAFVFRYSPSNIPTMSVPALLPGLDASIASIYHLMKKEET